MKTYICRQYAKKAVDLLGVTCDYLLKNEPELKKEVHGIMKPLFMLQSERMEYAIGRIVEKYRSSGQSRQEEAEEKIEEYWKQ